MRKAELAHRDAGPPRGDPICRVKGNDLFVLSDKQWERIVYQGRENGVDFLPVPCGDRVGFVDPRATNFRSVSWLDTAGARHVTQLTETQCGWKVYGTWTVDAAGHRTLQSASSIVHDGC